MDPATVQTIYRFNTWANESIREGIQTADEDVLRQPRDVWFGSVFKILAHICSVENVWLARMRDGSTTVRASDAGDLTGKAALIERWRDLDAQWEAYVATLSAEQLAADFTATRRDGVTSTYKLWQPVLQVAFHSTEHRGHATVVMTQLGIKHGPQDFLDQFRPTEDR